jgi:putative phosphoserine phosphatase/1-acylglycerol-3-phosphate O-acyltransferase
MCAATSTKNVPACVCDDGNVTRAAFFDLDRTLLGDSSGFLIMEALAEKGLISERQQSLAEVGRSVFRVLGETRVGMEITRRSISRLAGWTRHDLREAAERSLEKLDAAVYAEARTLIDRHHAAGDLVVIATSTGRDIVEPLAERLGVDRLIATEYEESDGKLTGGFIGKWLWGPDKAEAVREFAEREDIDLEDSYAYSDSYYDRHLLEMVGYPRPVNPDPLLRAYSVRKGWPVLEFRNRAGLPKMAVEPYDLIRPFAHPLLSPIEIIAEGVPLIPRDGPVIVAANHRSYLDPVILAAVASRRGRKLRYLGKKELFDAPLVGQAMRILGQIRVDRGTGGTLPLQQGVDALNRGEAVGIFPQGTIPRGEAFFDPALTARSGVARLAVASDAPVVPVAIWDSERIWPRSSRLPKVMEVVTRRPVHARVGEPIQLKGDVEDTANLRELAQHVMDRIVALLPDEVRNPPKPSQGQIEAATPPPG